MTVRPLLVGSHAPLIERKSALQRMPPIFQQSLALLLSPDPTSKDELGQLFERACSIADESHIPSNGKDTSSSDASLPKERLSSSSSSSSQPSTNSSSSLPSLNFSAPSPHQPLPVLSPNPSTSSSSSDNSSSSASAATLIRPSLPQLPLPSGGGRSLPTLPTLPPVSYRQELGHVSNGSSAPSTATDAKASAPHHDDQQPVKVKKREVPDAPRSEPIPTKRPRGSSKKTKLLAVLSKKH